MRIPGGNFPSALVLGVALIIAAMILASGMRDLGQSLSSASSNISKGMMDGLSQQNTGLSYLHVQMDGGSQPLKIQQQQ